MGAGQQAGGGFAMSPAELDAVIALWTEQVHLIGADEARIAAIARSLRPPASDPASAGYVRSGLRTVEALLAHNRSMLDYAQRYVAKLQAARSGTAAGDAAGADAVRAVTTGED